MTTISPSVSSGEHPALVRRATLRAFIDGRFEVLDGAEPLVVENPATEERLAVVRASSAGVVDRAVAGAARALADGRWSRLNPGRSARSVRRRSNGARSRT
jgi:acyl-CoA reductase-like NAD-dependent aldehyde dehydrogenase